MKQSNEYRNEMEKLHYTQQQQAELVRRLQSEAAQADSNQRRHPVKYWRTALVAAAMAAVLAVTVSATGVLRDAADVFADVFHLTPEQTEIVDRIGRPVNASDTQNGLTITADAILGDKNNVCLVYSLHWEDGMIPEMPKQSNGKYRLGFGSAYTDLGTKGGGHSSSYFQISPSEEGTIQYIEMSSADDTINLNHGKAEGCFEDLYAYDENGDPVLLVEGSWKVRFDLNYEDSSVQLGGGQTFQMDGIDYTLDRVQISPVAYRVEYTADVSLIGGAIDDEEKAAQRLEQLDQMLNVPIQLTKTDGTVVDLNQSGGNIRPVGKQAQCSRSTLFETVLPLEEIESITVGDVEIPLH